VSGTRATPSDAVVIDEVVGLCRRLRLKYVREQLTDVVLTARAQRWDPAEALRVLLVAEISGDNFSAAGGTTTITDPHGNEEVQQYVSGAMLTDIKGANSSSPAAWIYRYDPTSLGQTSITDPNGHTTTATYDTSGNKLTSTDANSQTTTWTYNSLDEPLTVTDPVGVVTTYTYDPHGNVSTKEVTGTGTSPPTETTTYTYGNGNLGDLTKVTDPAGRVTDYTYDSYGDRISTTTHPGTATQTSATTSFDHFTYASISSVGSLVNNNGNGLSTLSVNPATAGDAWVLGIKISSGTLSVSSVSGGGATWTKLTSSADASQAREVEEWLGTITTTGSSTITVTYSGDVSSINTEIDAQEFTNSTGAGTTWTEDVVGASQNDTASTTITFPSLTPTSAGELYVGFGRAESGASAGSTTGFTYETSTNSNPYIFNPNVSGAVSPTGTQAPAGASVTVGSLIKASGSGPTITRVSPNTGPTAGGTSVTITGIRLGGTTAVHFGSSAATSFSVVGPTSVTATAPSGSAGTTDVTVTATGVDSAQDVYDADGELVCEASPVATAAGLACPAPGGTRVAGTTTLAYNGDGQVTSLTDPVGNSTSTTYDGDGNVTQVSDPLSEVTKTAYDPDDRRATVTSGYGTSSASTTTYTYDIAPTSCSSAPSGTTYCTQVRNGLSQTTTNFFNALDQKIESAPPDATAQSVVSYTYDGVGNTLTKTDGSGTATYTYDSDNRLTGITYSATPTGMSQPHAVTYSYDADGNRTQMTDATGTTTYTYDALERLDKVTDGASQVVTYGFDADNNTTCLSYPNSGTTTCLNASSGTGIISYAYDGANELTSMTDWLGTGNTTTFAYDADGNLANTTFPSGTTASTSHTHDASDALTDTSIKIGSTTTDLAALTRNADENIATTTPPTGGATTYGYDPLNRVTTGTTAAYTYDAASQLVTSTPTGGSATDYAYNTDGQLCWTASSSGSCGSAPTGATTYSDNPAGERVSSTPSGGQATTEGWDQAGDLTCETAPNSSSYSCASQNAAYTTTFAYNGDGLRTSDVPAGGSTQQFTWDVASSVPNLLEDGTNYYLYGPNVDTAPVEQISASGSTPSWLISDTTGVREQVSSTGTVTGSMSYDTYGNRCSSCSISTPFGFEGAYSDGTGFVYLVHRYYDPATGQFLSSDPLVNITGQPYAYSNDDPVNESDPLGLWGWNPISDVTQAWNDTGGKAVHYVATHPKEAIGIGLGVVAVATGGAGLLVGGAAATTILSATAVGTGLGASALDYGACRSGSTAACVGAGLGFIGSIAGGGPLAASIGGIADESLAGSLLTGLLGGFSLNFGAAGLTWDISTLIANLLNGPNCSPAK